MRNIDGVCRNKLRIARALHGESACCPCARRRRVSLRSSLARRCATVPVANALPLSLSLRRALRPRSTRHVSVCARHRVRNAAIRASLLGLGGGASSLRFRFFIDSGFGPLALLRLNCTFVCTRVDAPGSSCSACRSCIGTAPRVSCARRTLSAAAPRGSTARAGPHRVVPLLLGGQLHANAGAVHKQDGHASHLRTAKA